MSQRFAYFTASRYASTRAFQSAASAWSLDALARRRAVVAQHASVEADFTVLETVLLGRSPHPGRGDAPEDLAAARRALESEDA